MLGDLKDEAVLSALNLERIENGRKFTFELHIDDGADNLGNFTGGGTEATFTSQIRSVKIEAFERERRGRFVTYAWSLAWSASVTRSYEIIIIIFRHSTSSKTQQKLPQSKFDVSQIYVRMLLSLHSPQLSYLISEKQNPS